MLNDTLLLQSGSVDESGASPLPASTASRRIASAAGDEFDEILALARESGMLITLDGQIGRERYQSITGSLASLRRFVAALHLTRTDRSVSSPSLPGANAIPVCLSTT